MEHGFAEELTEYAKRNDRYPFHMPGHKRQSFEAATKKLEKAKVDTSVLDRFCVPAWLDTLYEVDVTEVPDLDDNNHPQNTLLSLKNEVESFYHTDASFLMVNGSSGGLIAAIEATTKMGDEVLLARNCHTSVYREIAHRGLYPRYIHPQMEDRMWIATEILASDVERMLKEYPRISVVIIVSPTYEGVFSDVASIARVVHAHGKVLIVDEAHGAHIPFTDRFVSAVELGADLVVQSLHKMLPAPTQTAILHCRSARVDMRLLYQAVSFVQTTSPSYLLVSGMDVCLRYMMKVGKPLHELMYRQLDEFYKKVASLTELVFFDARQRDSSKLVFGAKHNKMDGPALARWLREHAGIELEMCSLFYVLLMVTSFDDADALDRLYSSLEKLNRHLATLPHKEPVRAFAPLSIPRLGVSPYEALWCAPDGYKMEERMVSDTEGFMAADVVYVYPPGVPILVAGEYIGKEQISALLEYQVCGFEVHGLTEDGRLRVWVAKP